MLGPTWNITGSVFYTNRRIEPDRSRDARAVGATLGFNTLLAHNLKVGADYTLLREHADDDEYSRRLHGHPDSLHCNPRPHLQPPPTPLPLHTPYHQPPTHLPTTPPHNHSPATTTTPRN